MNMPVLPASVDSLIDAHCMVPIQPSVIQELPCTVAPQLTQPPLSEPILPVATAMAIPTFTWGTLDASTFITTMSKVYEEVVHWKRNIFMIPSGNSSTLFILELARLYRAYAESSTLECIALKATIVLSILALQKPYKNSKEKII